MGEIIYMFKRIVWRIGASEEPREISYRNPISNTSLYLRKVLQSRMFKGAVFRHPNLTHHRLGRQVDDRCISVNSIESEFVESETEASTGSFGGEALAPNVRV